MNYSPMMPLRDIQEKFGDLDEVDIDTVLSKLKELESIEQSLTKEETFELYHRLTDVLLFLMGKLRRHRVQLRDVMISAITQSNRKEA